MDFPVRGVRAVRIGRWSMAAGSSAPAATAPAAGGNAAGASQAPAQNVSVIPFLRGSGKGKYKFFSKSGVTLTSQTSDLGPIDIKAYDYMRSILLTVTTTTAGGATGTAQADSPFNWFTNVGVVQPNGQTMYQVSSGYHAAMIQR